MLALAGGCYQGVFRNPLADPYLLGVAAGAGLGRHRRRSRSASRPDGVDAGRRCRCRCARVRRRARSRSSLTYVLGAAGGRDRTPGDADPGRRGGGRVPHRRADLPAAAPRRDDPRGLLLAARPAGHRRLARRPAAAALRRGDRGGGAAATAASSTCSSVGDDEAASLGLHPQRSRYLLVAAASLGTAAAVSVSGLIGFVGIIVPHTVRLLAGTSYRVILPLSHAVRRRVPGARRPGRPDRRGARARSRSAWSPRSSARRSSSWCCGRARRVRAVSYGAIGRRRGLRRDASAAPTILHGVDLTVGRASGSP